VSSSLHNAHLSKNNPGPAHQPAGLPAGHPSPSGALFGVQPVPLPPHSFVVLDPKTDLMAVKIKKLTDHNPNSFFTHYSSKHIGVNL